MTLAAHRIYLDYNATTPVCAEALRAYAEASAFCGNPSSVHLDGQDARHRLEEARQGLATLWGIAPQELIFTSGATESNNLAVKGIARERAKSGKKHVLVGATEHPSVLDAAGALRSEGFEIERLPVNKAGRIEASDLTARIRPETALIAIMAANNETGVIQPLEQIWKAASEAGVPLHADWVQGLGKLPVNLTNCSSASFSGHKVYGPKGIGVLYTARRVRLAALVHGGPQENNLRAGTESPELAGAMLAAVRVAEVRRAADDARFGEFKKFFLGELARLVSGWSLNGAVEDTLSQTANISFDGVDGSSLVRAMDLAGFSLSGGSACAAGSVEPSHVLAAMGHSEAEAAGAVRISFGHLTTRDDLSRCAETLGREIARLRKRA